jgi:hypothetical protein
MERETRFELATPTLARLCSTTELFPPDSRANYTDKSVTVKRFCIPAYIESLRCGQAARR